MAVGSLNNDDDDDDDDNMSWALGMRSDQPAEEKADQNRDYLMEKLYLNAFDGGPIGYPLSDLESKQSSYPHPQNLFSLLPSHSTLDISAST